MKKEENPMAKKNDLEILTNYQAADKHLHEIGINESLIAKKEAQMNEQIQNLKERFNEETKDARAKVLTLSKEVETFCMLNKKDFDKKRTRTLTHGIIGFRTATPKVALLNRKYNWKTVLELVKKVFDGKYVRTKEEVNKDELLSAVSQSILSDEQLAAIGMKVDQDEKFMYEIDWEKLDVERAA
jgi:phage host-nuclease inhibitor protein Gam